ncbi:hypothetical protein N7481_008196 [Penicillium waksmanii]|uniref:uncharacterized protein n=1 Tax=Penicillium waksmanii TaxID=69791 RepID=UPI002549026A|nr:uncharacterized protein N7481_008196 [Penicillium waksmanii]KAJ5980898.1 hypothetical protein N7481_008196 [Penicillium waksmanii]
MASKLITVFGATGNQGGSVARSLVKNKAFHVRGVTRNLQSESSSALSVLGVEMVQADGFNPDQMKAAFQDTWGIFLNINSDDKIFTNQDGPSEFDMGKVIVDAAAEAGVQHVVFSSGPACTEMTNGKVSMKAMDMKCKIEQYIKDLGIFKSVIPLGAAWFLENFLSKEVAPVFGGFPYFPDASGHLVFRCPYWGGKEDVPWVSISDDFGDIVHGAFLDPETWNRHFIHVLSDIRSFPEAVADFQEVTGREAIWDPILPSWEAFETHGIHELEDVKLMFGFTQITGGMYFGGPTERETAHKLKKATAIALGYPEEKQGLVTLKDWFAARFGNMG